MATSDSHPEFGVYVPNVTLGLARSVQAVSAGWRGNEPAGMTLGTEKAFDTLSELDGVGGWYLTNTTGNKAIVSDSSASQSPSNVLRHTYFSGHTGGTAGTSAGWVNQVSASEIYICINIKWDSNWQFHPADVQKVLFVTMSDFGGGGDPVYLALRSGDPANLTLAIYIQGPNGIGRVLPFDAAVNPQLGIWHTVEIYMKANSNSVTSDGAAKMWMDGQQITDTSDVLFFNDAAASGKFNNVKLEPTWGGAGGEVTSPFWIQHDHIYVGWK